MRIGRKTHCVPTASKSEVQIMTGGTSKSCGSIWLRTVRRLAATHGPACQNRKTSVATALDSLFSLLLTTNRRPRGRAIRPSELFGTRCRTGGYTRRLSTRATPRKLCSKTPQTAIFRLFGPENASKSPCSWEDVPKGCGDARTRHIVEDACAAGAFR